ncbi:MAG: DNA polymerase III subunit gamma/tau [Dehalococcoidia bacterium]|nr:DNA polymerase III subunit gamma/tau [Dehalococcoidia bacterium]
MYRKWRPQTLAEVVGQEPIIQTLQHAVENKKVAHAYLFCGPRGTGKTSTARILAKAINCPNQAHGEPCNTCNMCSSITEGKALDVIEIDAASNRGIDDIRNLREKVNYAPSLAPYKVYIIDEVHMLTEAASNALLKTLEEPPPCIVFILATTEPHKVLSTITSRCQRFNFRRLSQTAIAGKLQLICQREGINIELEPLKVIAHEATGSLRDAENIFQQLLAYYGNQINLSQVQTALGLSSNHEVKQLARHIVNKDIPAGLQVINSVNSEGIDFHQFNQALVKYLRGLLLTKSQCEESLDITNEDSAEMKKLVAASTLEYLLRATKLFSSVDFRSDNYNTLSLELALIECALPSMGKQEKSPPPAYPEVNEATESPQEPGKAIQKARTPVEVNSTEISHMEAPQNIDAMRTQWREFIRSLHGEGSNGHLDAFLRSACEPISLVDNTLTLGFYYPFHKEKIEDPKYRRLIERKLKEIFNQPYRIKCTLVAHKKKMSSQQPGERNHVIKAALEMGARIIDQ